jgi:hypothetical protein
MFPPVSYPRLKWASWLPYPIEGIQLLDYPIYSIPVIGIEFIHPDEELPYHSE